MPLETYWEFIFRFTDEKWARHYIPMVNTVSVLALKYKDYIMDTMQELTL